MTATSEQERLARAALSVLADPGDPALGALLRSCDPQEIVAAVCSDGNARCSLPLPAAGARGLDRALLRWRSRLGRVPTAARLQAWRASGYRLVCPGEPEWPTQLDDLGDVRPVLLWLRGAADLRFACLRSVSVVGARAATSYGSHVAADLAAVLAERGWTVISGGAFGIDASAHRGVLAVSGRTVAVLAGGLSVGYPKGHHELFGTIREHGLLASEWPPDQPPNRPAFLIRNRVIAALSRGTVVVEAALRSGALSTARQARELNRHVMAVPGPITSEQSAGCHQLIREFGAVCVTSAADVAELLGPLGGGQSDPAATPAGEALGAGGEGAASPAPGALTRPPRQAASAGPAVPADDLDPVTAAVLRAAQSRAGRGPAAIATIARVDLDTALRCLGLLAAAGHVERCATGWRASGGK